MDASDLVEDRTKVAVATCTDSGGPLLFQSLQDEGEALDRFVTEPSSTHDSHSAVVGIRLGRKVAVSGQLRDELTDSLLGHPDPLCQRRDRDSALDRHAVDHPELGRAQTILPVAENNVPDLIQQLPNHLHEVALGIHQSTLQSAE
jgi:hypothetical protein